MENKKLRSGQDVLMVETDSAKLVSIIEGNLYLRHLIPEFELGDNSCDPRQILKAYQGDCKLLDEDYSITVKADFESTSEGQICHLISYAMQRAILENGFCTIHAGAIANNDLATLLIGPSKTGKSTFTLELALEKGCKIFGDDAAKLSLDKDKILVQSGNTHIGVSPIHRNHRRIRSIFSDHPLPPYVDSRFLGINTNKPAQLAKVIFLEPDLLGSNNTQEIDDTNGKIRLYSAISEEMRATGYCLMKEGIALPSIDKFGRGQRALETLKNAQLRFFKVSGNFYKMLGDIESIVYS